MVNLISKKYIQGLEKKNLREDGRDFEEYRKPVKIEYGVSPRSAEGSARITIGETVVVAGVKFEVTEPYPDSPDEGSMMINVELTPLSSPEFESGPPSIEAIELARVVDRGIRESKAIDFKKLCITKGEKVWFIIVDIYPINAAGNMFDACALATMAAIKDAKFPKLTKEGNIDYESERTDKGIPLNFYPVSCTVHKIGKHLYIDPTEAEEEASEARLTVVMTEKSKICAMQKGGEKPLTQEEIEEIVNLADKKTQELRKVLENEA